MKTINNHSIKFSYTNAGPARRMNGQHGDYFVLADSKQIGIIRKAPGGWHILDNEDRNANYRTGPRDYAAQHIAFLAGLLDGNYNAING